MNAIVREFHDVYAQYTEACDAIWDKISEKQAQISKLNAEIEHLECSLRNIPNPYFFDCVRKLAKELAKQSYKHVRVDGPYGLRSECVIWLSDVKDFDPCKDPVWSLIVIPVFKGGGFNLYYDTGESLIEYPRGSIASLNRFGNKTLPLPESIEEIYALFEFTFHHE